MCSIKCMYMYVCIISHLWFFSEVSLPPIYFHDARLGVSKVKNNSKNTYKLKTYQI